MKKLFALVLVFALFLSACGKTEEPVVEPNEEPSEIKNSETEEISEEFVEEIILNLDAEKLGDGTFRTSKTGGFFFNTEFEDGSKLETKYYFYWATRKFVEKYRIVLQQKGCSLGKKQNWSKMFLGGI